MEEQTKYCHLCGRAITLYYAGDTDTLKFCTNAHKNEWHNIFPLSCSRFNVLEILEEGDRELAYTNTVYIMSDINSGRDMPMIECLNPDDITGKKFRITDFGKKVLDTYRKMLYTE